MFDFFKRVIQWPLRVLSSPVVQEVIFELAMSKVLREIESSSLSEGERAVAKRAMEALIVQIKEELSK